jgi:hypothetical protein
LSKLVGLEGPYVHYGSMPSIDVFSYKVAIQTVMALRCCGKRSASHTQYESVRSTEQLTPTMLGHHCRQI